ncbi:MAG: BTAD domain-containing putative transcriptional regulator [Caldilineaceae bacterium]
MTFPVTQTQVILPRRRADIVSRERLVELLQRQLDRKLLLIIAPAGYGKTSLLIDLAHQIDTPLCWYAVDSLDQNLPRFLNHFIAAIAQRYPQFGAESAAFLQSLAANQGTLEQMITIMVNELYEKVPEHFVLVVDDYHLVSSTKPTEIDQFISQFVQRSGNICNLILASRQLLSLPDLPLLVARSLVGGIGLEDLAFQIDEIQALYIQNHNKRLSDTAALDMIDATEGWITGLLLSAQAPQPALTLQFRAMRASGVSLYDYLTDQIFDQQEAELQKFLLYTSLFKEFDHALCAAVLGSLWPLDHRGWTQIIENVISRNLFVLPVGDNGEWVRYHHLFRDFLRKKIFNESPAIARTILERLLHLYKTDRKWEEAHEVCQMLDDPQMTADLIVQAGDSLLHSGQNVLLSKWIGALPELLVEQRPALLSFKGCILVAQGKHEQGLTLLNQAEAALQRDGDEAQHAITLTRRATAYRLLGNYQAADADAERAFAQLNALMPRIAHTGAPQDANQIAEARATACSERGLSACQRGDLDTGIHWLMQARDHYSAIADLQNAAGATNDIALAHLHAGKYVLADAEFRRTLTFWQEVQNIFRQAHTLNNLGFLCHQQGAYAQAHEYLTEALRLAKRCGYKRIQAFGLVSLGDLYVDLDCVEQARETYAEARKTVDEIDERFLAIYLELAEANLACLTSDWLQAYNHLDHASQLVLDRHSRYEWGLYRMAMGQFYLSQDKSDRAITLLSDAASAFEEGGQRKDAAQTRLVLAAACYQSGDAETAYAQLAQCAILMDSLESDTALLVAGRRMLPQLEGLAAQIQAELPKLLDFPFLADPQTDFLKRPTPAAKRTEAALFVTALLKKIALFAAEIVAIQQKLFPQEAQQTPAPTSHPAAEISAAPPMPVKSLVVRTLGRIEIIKKGEPVRGGDWQAQSARDLFLCLLAHPDGLTKEEIGALFWSDSAPAQLKARFKNMVYRLRRALDPDTVMFTDNVYMFNRELDYSYDVEEFLGFAARANEANALEEKKQLLQAAIELYQGDYLPDTDAMWAWLERERLRRIFTEINLNLGELHLELSEFAEAIAVCQALFNEDSCLEDAHRLAMRVYAAMGNRAAVVRQYEQCLRALREEVDAPPSDQTNELFEMLME